MAVLEDGRQAFAHRAQVLQAGNRHLFVRLAGDKIWVIIFQNGTGSWRYSAE